MSTLDEFEGMIKYHKGRACFKNMSEENKTRVLEAYALFKLLDMREPKIDAEITLMFNLYKRAHIVLFYLNKGMRNFDIKGLDDTIDMLRKSLSI